MLNLLTLIMFNNSVPMVACSGISVQRVCITSSGCQLISCVVDSTIALYPSVSTTSHTEHHCHSVPPSPPYPPVSTTSHTEHHSHTVPPSPPYPPVSTQSHWASQPQCYLPLVSGSWYCMNPCYFTLHCYHNTTFPWSVEVVISYVHPHQSTIYLGIWGVGRRELLLALS